MNILWNKCTMLNNRKILLSLVPNQRQHNRAKHLKLPNPLQSQIHLPKPLARHLFSQPKLNRVLLLNQVNRVSQQHNQLHQQSQASHPNLVQILLIHPHLESLMNQLSQLNQVMILNSLIMINMEKLRSMSIMLKKPNTLVKQLFPFMLTLISVNCWMIPSTFPLDQY